MKRIGFTLRRVVFSQPIGMTFRILKRKLTYDLSGPLKRTGGRLAIDDFYGTETSGLIAARDLRTGSYADVHSYGYGASLPSIIRQAIVACPNLHEASFVDLGCGKGLPLVVASEYPFRRIMGVELSPELSAVARDNAARIAASHPARTRIEILEGDMVTAELPSGYLIVYLYNPAYPPLIKRLVEKLAKLQVAGQKLMIIYYNPAAARHFDNCRSFSRYFAEHIAFTEQEATTSQVGNTADSVVIWQSANDPIFMPLPRADAAVDLVAGGSAGQVRQQQ